METIFFTLLLLMAIFLILLVLVQRGRGGGLAGALGGPGGSSAFGAKAGDTFTKITVWAASIWIVTCIAASYWATHQGDALGSGQTNTVSSTIDLGGAGASSDETDATEEPAADEAAAEETPAEPSAEASSDESSESENQ